jgi:hypothetical protein
VPDDSPLRQLPEDVQKAILAELIAAYAEGGEPDREKLRELMGQLLAELIAAYAEDGKPDREKLRELMGRPVWVVYGDQARPEEGR